MDDVPVSFILPTTHTARLVWFTLIAGSDGVGVGVGQCRLSARHSPVHLYRCVCVCVEKDVHACVRV